MGKDKKKDKSILENSAVEESGPSYEDKLKHVSVISKPMASKKLTKKVG